MTAELCAEYHRRVQEGDYSGAIRLAQAAVRGLTARIRGKAPVRIGRLALVKGDVAALARDVTADIEFGPSRRSEE